MIFRTCVRNLGWMWGVACLCWGRGLLLCGAWPAYDSSTGEVETFRSLRLTSKPGWLSSNSQVPANKQTNKNLPRKAVSQINHQEPSRCCSRSTMLHFELTGNLAAVSTWHCFCSSEGCKMNGVLDSFPMVSEKH